MQYLSWYTDSNKEEQQGAVLMSTKYLASDPSGRDPDTPILVIKQGT